VANRFEATPEFNISVRPNRERSAEEQDYIVTLIAEHTLGVGVQEGRFSELFPRGTKIPARQVKTYMNPDQATHIRADIFQGEGDYVYDNVLIGTIHLDDIEPRPEGYHKFEVEFSLDENGLLGVQVTHTNTGREYQATFDQSTTIGKLDELALRRAALAEMHANGGGTNGAGGQSEHPAPQQGPAITIPPPASGPGAAATGSVQGNDANRD
jgi:molecular chaperone DnaK (HSP70)